MPKICKWCGSKEHTQFYCYQKPRKAIAKVSKKRLENPKPKKTSKPINKVGKKAKAWTLTSKEWKIANPPDSYCFWYCRVGGSALTDKRDVDAFRLNLCHDLSRARRPDLANEISNIYPGCQKHNKAMGSTSFEEYMSGDHDSRCGDF